ncbi:MAG: AAA family ATPase, partial [Flavobacteriales bacterium]|nr:AAA family ATPase [Flavobacteriales bacterium]
MLRRLTISNYLLIDGLDLPLGEGLSIITGETGSGKSILLGALGLATGERAESG